VRKEVCLVRVQSFCVNLPKILIFGIMFFCALPVGLAASAEERSLTFFNSHTNERETITFKRDGKFLDDGLAKFNHFARDWRRNEQTKMDPEVLDLIWTIYQELGSKQPIKLISGYRSPTTNESLRRRGGGQAKHSRHMTGQACDIQFPDIPLKQLRSSALIQERGGVGYYPGSGVPFVHVDTGNVRYWPRMPRQELALLFPSGHTRYIPADGRPITPADSRLALASLQKRGGELPWALQKRKPTTVLASLGPSSFPSFGLKALKPKPKPSPAATEDAEATVPAGLLKPDSLTQNSGQPPFGQKDEIRLSEEGDEQDDEMLFEPLPIVELLTDTPLAQIEIHEEQRPLFQKVNLLLSAPSLMASTEFENGLQIEDMYAVHRFEGSAISLVQHTLREAAAKRLASAGGTGERRQ
jgi:uncharacterized protein YcbK (DUF882 family)